MGYKQALALRGFLEGGPDNYYQGAAGQLPGSADSSAMALFRVWDRQADPQVIFCNMDSGENSGWSIELGDATGGFRVRAIDSVAGAVQAIFDAGTDGLQFQGKLILLGFSITGGNIDCYAQGQLEASVAIPNAYVPGVGAPTVGQFNDGAGGVANGIEVIGCGYNDGALDAGQWARLFDACVEMRDLADITAPNESADNGGLSNLWRARNLIQRGVPGTIERGDVDGIELDLLPLPNPSWVDARDPTVFQLSPGAGANAPLIALAANEFNVGNADVGVVGIPNPTWV